MSRLRFKFVSFVHRALAAQYRNPTKSVTGLFASQLYRKQNSFLETTAVQLCEIEPHHKVLEVGFGNGDGLSAACKAVQDGSGKVHGIDQSEYMVGKVHRSLRHFIRAGKLEVVHSNVLQLPFPSHNFDRIFHCNCYYYWSDPMWACAEIYRVVKPGGLLVTTMDLKQDKRLAMTGLLNDACPDILQYMHALEAVGFNDVRIEYLKDNKTGQEFQAIFAQAGELQENPSVERTEVN